MIYKKLMTGDVNKNPRDITECNEYNSTFPPKKRTLLGIYSIYPLRQVLAQGHF